MISKRMAAEAESRSSGVCGKILRAGTTVAGCAGGQARALAQPVRGGGKISPLSLHP